MLLWQNKTWEKMKVGNSLQLTAGYPTCNTHRWVSAGWSQCWPLLVSKYNFLMTTTSCKILVFAIPLKGITRSIKRIYTKDALRLGTKFYKSKRKIINFFMMVYSITERNITPRQTIKHPCHNQTTSLAKDAQMFILGLWTMRNLMYCVKR